MRDLQDTRTARLLDAAEAGGFDVLVTGDGTLSLEQNMKRRRIALVSLSAISWPDDSKRSEILDTLKNGKM